MATQAMFRIWRGDPAGGRFEDYVTPVEEGMVVLDAVHRIQAQQAPDLALRWNCKAGKCGSCSAEINGVPKLMCMTRLSNLNLNMPVILEPMHTFPVIRDLVTDVSWNFRAKKTIKPFRPRSPDMPDGTWRMQQADVERVQEFRKCIECFLCQDVCHVLREHHKEDEFIGPRLLVFAAALEMHPLDTEDRVSDLRKKHNIGYCNITTCCRQVCPESITITENAIIPLKERVVDRFFDPSEAAVSYPLIGRGGPMFALKPISRDSLEGALAKAERYRFLNEPSEAESICRDILEVDPLNRDARISLILALTDEFPRDAGPLPGQWRRYPSWNRLRSRLLLRDRVGTAGQGVPRCRQAGVQWPCVRMDCQGAGAIRGSGAHTAGRQRRLDSALECLCSFSRAPQNRGAEDGRC